MLAILGYVSESFFLSLWVTQRETKSYEKDNKDVHILTS